MIWMELYQARKLTLGVFSVAPKIKKVYNGITTCFDPKNIYQGEDATNPYHALRYTGPSPYPAIQTERKHVLLPDTGSDTISAVPNVLDNLQSD